MAAAATGETPLTRGQRSSRRAAGSAPGERGTAPQHRRGSPPPTRAHWACAGAARLVRRGCGGPAGRPRPGPHLTDTPGRGPARAPRPYLLVLLHGGSQGEPVRDAGDHGEQHHLRAPLRPARRSAPRPPPPAPATEQAGNYSHCHIRSATPAARALPAAPPETARAATPSRH